MFTQIVQAPEETVDQFVCRLRQRAATCVFDGREDEYIRDQLIDKCKSQKLRRKFLEKDGNTSLNNLLVIAWAHEAVKAQLKAMGTSKDPEMLKLQESWTF